MSAEPKSFFIRATYSYADLQPLILIWSPLCEKMAIYEHIGEETEKIHCHIALVNAKIGKKQLMNKAAKAMPKWSGNETYSCKAMDDGFDRQYVYMTKGIYEPSYLLGFTQADADLWKSKWVHNSEATSVDELHYNDCFKDYPLQRYYDLFEEQKDALKIQYKHDEDTLQKALVALTPDKVKREIYNNILKTVNKYITDKVVKTCNHKFFQLQKTLVLTYCYRNNVQAFGRLSGFLKV